MIVRALDKNNDWTFGKSLNNYISGNAAVIQNIKTRLQCFIGDCFFDIIAGVNWLTFLGGSKNQQALQVNISAVILNTAFVTGINQLSVNLDSNRSFSIAYQAQSVYSIIGDSFQYNIGF